MPKLTVEGYGTVDVENGKRLVLAIEQDAKVDILHACGGNARCTTCRVEFIDGEPAAHTAAETERLTARGLTGVKLVTSDAHAGLVAAIGATLPGASWQRCRTHYAANLMSATPKSSWPWVKTLLYSLYDQPDAASVKLSIN